MVKAPVHGDKSKLALLSATEQIRSHSLPCGQVRCQRLMSGRFGCFSDLGKLFELMNNRRIINGQ